MSTSTIRAKEAMLRKQEEETLSLRNSIWRVLMRPTAFVETLPPSSLCCMESELDERNKKASVANYDLYNVLASVENWRYTDSVSDDMASIRVDALSALMNAWIRQSYREYWIVEEFQQRAVDAENRAKAAEEREKTVVKEVSARWRRLLEAAEDRAKVAEAATEAAEAAEAAAEAFKQRAKAAEERIRQLDAQILELQEMCREAPSH